MSIPGNCDSPNPHIHIYNIRLIHVALLKTYKTMAAFAGSHHFFHYGTGYVYHIELTYENL
jgi:hypothetical protein